MYYALESVGGEEHMAVLAEAERAPGRGFGSVGPCFGIQQEEPVG